jgi:hypothetical protein
MKENVGRTDRRMRAAVGPALFALGYTRFGGREGRVGGLALMIAAALVVESAITRVCPVNALLGIDTTEDRREPVSKADAPLGIPVIHPLPARV